ncbi:MAG: hypothetical protein Q9225_006340 [Loekoesia sp. 1 TL-2023]
MSASKDPDHFFQTSHSLAESERKSRKSKNKNGNPIRLPSKILAAIVDPTCPNDAVYIAESAGNVRRIVVDVGEAHPSSSAIQLVQKHREPTDEKDTIYRGPTAPVTSIAISPDGQRVLAGSWDKSIWSWFQYSRQPLVRYHGHTDFVKCVVTMRLGHTDIVISGAADASIIVWNLSMGEKFHVLKGHTRGILDLAIDPMIYDLGDNARDGVKEALIFSAGSDREIRRWRISLGAAEQVDPEKLILAHETSVCALRFDSDGDLWTASADGTTKCLSRSRQFQSDTTIQHEDYVRAVVIDEIGGYVITAGRSEDIKVWDRGSGDLFHVFEGHFEEVTGLVMLGQRCVSVGIDGTIRVWSLKPEDMRDARRKQGEEQEALIASDATAEEELGTAGGLTEEEERELAELMEDDDT